ncbi:CMRF35-like molecule 6 [Marmota marmota marmota]|uniref:CMRF35-like molecule 6 n=1 Tax=Marmota marmota marmota TaxID=9994 RepID=UPI0020924C0B|nr:CMRF35-like molecule 6 [Marmota marmota marmota]
MNGPQGEREVHMQMPLGWSLVQGGLVLCLEVGEGGSPEDVTPGPPGPGPSVRAWPPSLCFSDCVPLSGPSKVTGTVGGSLIVQCQYGKQFRTKDKLWCKKSVFFCYDIVKTRGSGGEVRSGRVSISDHPANLSFTVTMERLTLEDAGSYECRVDTPRYKGFFPYFKVEVAVLPALTTASSPESRTSTQRPPTSLSTYTWPLTTREDTPSPHPQPG